MKLNRTQAQILATLNAKGGALSLQEVSAAAKVSDSMVLRHLRMLEDAGLVRRTGERKLARYAPLHRLEVHWNGDVGNRYQQEARWVLWEWSASVPVDWRFPLVSRIPDAPAQDAMYRFLGHAQQRGLFTPWKVADQARGAIEASSQDPENVLDRFGHESYHSPFCVAVYGSCARGDARHGSDLDVVIIFSEVGHPDFMLAYRRLFGGISNEMAPGATRPINLSLLTLDAFLRDEDFAHLRESIIADGITVYLSSPDGFWVEALRGGGHGFAGRHVS